MKRATDKSMGNRKPENQGRKGEKLTSESTICFQCKDDLDCFTTCCRNITILLTPHDVLRMKNHLGMKSWEFHNTYTHVAYEKDNPYPLVRLAMKDEEGLPCPFVESATGCTIYHNRPWSCRMFPLDVVDHDSYRIMVADDVCHGLREKRQWQVSEWLINQGVSEFEELNFLYSQLTSRTPGQEQESNIPQIREMVFMAAYDLDRFRRFVFESRFLSMFDIPEEEVELLKHDDEELLKLGFKWIGFGLINPLSIRIKSNIIEQYMEKRTES